MKKVRAEKKPPVSGAPAAQSRECAVLQGPAQTTEASTKPEHRRGGMEAAAAASSTPAGSAGHPALRFAQPAPAHLSLPADQAPAQPLLVPQELLAAAVTNYAHSVKKWSLGLDTKSPPLPPPPPQSSPVEFPGSGLYHLLPLGDLARHMDAGQTMDTSDVTTQ